MKKRTARHHSQKGEKVRMVKTYIDKKGYKVYADSGKRVHIVAMERMIGRSLRKGEHVHHINGIKTDNRRVNLELVKPKEHYEHHVARKKNANFRALVEIIKISIWILRLIIKLIIDIIIYVFKGTKGWGKSK